MFHRLGRCHFAPWCSAKTLRPGLEALTPDKETFFTYAWLFCDRIFFRVFPMCILGPTECLHRYGIVTIPTSTDLIECLLQSQLKATSTSQHSIPPYTLTSPLPVYPPIAPLSVRQVKSPLTCSVPCEETTSLLSVLHPDNR